MGMGINWGHDNKEKFIPAVRVEIEPAFFLRETEFHLVHQNDGPQNR